MEFLELVKIRYSVRRYKPDPVPEKDLLSCLEAARLAPSASNSQPWEFIVIKTPELRKRIAESTYSNLVSFNKFALQAPLIVAVIMKKGHMLAQIGASLQGTPYPLIDIGIAAEHFCLQAAERGLGTCMLGWFDENKVRKLLEIPKSKKIALLITVGYPADSPKPKKRKEMNAIVSEL
ncbi:MAG: Nitroreductase [Marinimicrobia bacterium 46_47]|nr:MAG: Nitroreductase [Marinimicrobia bacterium 46_47]KUK93145.1 MAG: Nitroreductase [Marinimicrobia bacterium 46_43]HBY18466.1 NAD(P)H nitroreductase [Candidatus Neomarinimicrobiota bacterium]